jgi:acetyl-CoA carboxylase biotin carboxyl carrier protein
MENKDSFYEEFDSNDSLSNGASEMGEQLGVEQLQRLVQLLDKSDVSELSVTWKQGSSRLALRKAKLSESAVSAPVLDAQRLNGAGTSGLTSGESAAVTVDTTHRVTAPLVGVFHVWAKPRGGTLVAVGDTVKAGQLVGTIQSLNVINEVETQYAGRVIEILVQEGQPVEYGQHLMTIESVE